MSGSKLSEAPPTMNPSMSSCVASLLQLPVLTKPKEVCGYSICNTAIYSISATVCDTLSFSH